VGRNDGHVPVFLYSEIPSDCAHTDACSIPSSVKVWLLLLIDRFLHAVDCLSESWAVKFDKTSELAILLFYLRCTVLQFTYTRMLTY
jgi:hypothetical protein